MNGSLTCALDRADAAMRVAQEASALALQRSKDALAIINEAINTPDNGHQTSSQPAAYSEFNRRQASRPARISKLDTDAELRVFVLARIDHLSFEQIAHAVARVFPAERCLGKSAIHAWWNNRSHSTHSE